MLFRGVIPLLALAALQRPAPVEDPPVAVRYREGVVHGFLLLRTEAGVLLAHGDLLQTARGDTVDARLIFRFKDGSLLDETVRYTQHDVFTMRSYHLTQSGPAFDKDTEAWMERGSGTYRVKTRSHKDNKEETHEGKVELPPDTYNGVVLTVLKNIPKAGGSVHMVAFMPEPKVVRVEIQGAAEQKVLLGDQAKSTFHFVLKPRLGTFTTLFAKLLGRFPPDNHAWILNDEVPAFVRFVGPLYPEGPIWRIEQTTLQWPEAGAQSTDPWQQEFAAEKSSLSATGKNPYFVLEPGYVSTLEDGSRRLVITVLNQTKEVDGVRTRVVEERETDKGKLLEVSRNYLAVDGKSGDLYDFGEDVDIYRGGKVTSHEGSWLAGVNSARFGLLLPGRAAAGARYYQEHAPGQAMDRAEILSISESVTTPAGRFSSCLKVEETTPLEPGTKEYKLYAPGVGLVQDGKLKLVSYHPAGAR